MYAADGASAELRLRSEVIGADGKPATDAQGGPLFGTGGQAAWSGRGKTDLAVGLGAGRTTEAFHANWWFKCGNADWLSIGKLGFTLGTGGSAIAKSGGGKDSPAPTPKRSSPSAAAQGKIVVPAAQSLTVGDSRTAVVELQKALSALSLYKGTADGIFGPALATAVAAYQRSRGLTAVGP